MELIRNIGGTEIFLRTKIFWDLTLFLTQNLLWPKMHLRMEFDSGVGPTCLHFCYKTAQLYFYR